MMAAAHNGDLHAARQLRPENRILRRARPNTARAQTPAQTSDLAPDSDWTVVAADIEDLAAQLGS